MILAAIALLAAAQPKMLAVLEFKDKLPKSGDNLDVGYLTDVVRDDAKDAVPSLKVMTRENMLVLLQSSGKSLADCEGECEVDTGRRIGADLVISGEVLRFGTQYKVNMKLHDTHEGELLAGAIAAGSTADQLDADLNRAVAKLLAPLKEPQPERKLTRREPPPQPTQQAQPQQAQPSPWPRATTSVSAPPPEPQRAEPEAPGFMSVLHVDAGYWSGSASTGVSGGSGPPTTTGGGSGSGLMLSVGALPSVRVSDVFRLGLAAEFAMFFDNGNTLKNYALGPGVALLFGKLVVSAAAGYGFYSDNGGSGLFALAGLDVPLAGPVALHAQLSWRKASNDLAGGLGTIEQTFLVGEAGLSLIF